MYQRDPSIVCEDAENEMFRYLEDEIQSGYISRDLLNAYIRKYYEWYDQWIEWCEQGDM